VTGVIATPPDTTLRRRLTRSVSQHRQREDSPLATLASSSLTFTTSPPWSFRMSLFPVYSLAVWTLAAPLLVAIVEWNISRRQRSELTSPQGKPGFAS
jgi:hypothetical protein